MKGMKALVLAFILLLLLTGCWDKKEVEERSYVVAIGLDLPQGIDIDKEQAIDVTFQFSNPKLNVKGAPQEGQPERRDIVTLTAPDLVTARNMANAIITREISYSHNKVLIISENLAKEESFARLLSTAIKDRELRRETNMIITKGKAVDFIEKNNPLMMVRPHKYYQFLIDRATETGLVPESTLNRFFAITDTNGGLFTAIYGSSDENQRGDGFQDEDQYVAGQVPEKGGNAVQLIGSAVFKDGKMIGTLNGEETRIVRMLDNTSNIRDLLSSFPDPLDDRYKIAVRIKKVNTTKVKIKLRNGPPKIEVTYPAELKIISAPSMIDYATNLENQKKLKEILENKMKENAENLIEKTQKEFIGDPFYWSLYARSLFSSVKEYEEWDWTNKNYPFADVEITMDIKFVGFGKQLREYELEKVIE